MLREGEVRIPSGCAIAAIIDRKGEPINGSEIIQSIALMHDRSNGLGGGFAAYGIYPDHTRIFRFLSCVLPVGTGTRRLRGVLVQAF